jgi:hypothetical protein
MPKLVVPIFTKSSTPSNSIDFVLVKLDADGTSVVLLASTIFIDLAIRVSVPTLVIVHVAPFHVALSPILNQINGEYVSRL